MPWVWSDELAEALASAGAAEATVRRLRDAPVAVAVPEGSDRIAGALERLGMEAGQRGPQEPGDDLLDSSQ
jgi:hypothetical protein